jgi:hypothetical protein
VALENPSLTGAPGVRLSIVWRPAETGLMREKTGDSVRLPVNRPYPIG